MIIVYFIFLRVCIFCVEMDWGKLSGLVDEFFVYFGVEEDFLDIFDIWYVVKSFLFVL